MAPKIVIPDPPAILPKKLQEKWVETYQERFDEAIAAEASEGDAHQTARIEANRLLKVKAPATYEDAKALPKWQIHGELVEKNGVLRGVTVDGKKFKFDVPAGKSGGKPPDPQTPPAP